MAKVKVLKAHGNGYGKAFQKKEGDTYDHPTPGGLVDGGLVKIMRERKPAPKPKPDGDKDGDKST